MVRSNRMEQRTKEEWLTLVDKTLKGKSRDFLNKRIHTTYSTKPLYTQEDIENIPVDELPGQGLSTRGFTKSSNNWINVNPSDLSSKARENQDSLSLTSQEIKKFPIAMIQTALNEIHKPIHFSLSTNEQSELAKELTFPSTTRGVFQSDPITEMVSTGKLWSDKEKKSWLDCLERLDQIVPNLKTIGIHLPSYHMAGANPFMELACMLSLAVEYIELGKEIGWTPEKTMSKLVVMMPIDSKFFIQISKVRAARGVWTTLLKAYGIEEDKTQMVISASTSCLTHSQIDSHVNILRHAEAAFAGVVGGIDYLCIRPFNTSHLANRIAHNIHALLKEESQLHRVIDPAGGSYSVETITHDFIKESWGKFQEQQREGGILQLMKTGKIQRDLKVELEAVKLMVETREFSLIGTNVYVDLEHKEELNNNSTVSLDNDPTGDEILPLTQLRLPELFENLPKQSFTAGVIGLGKLKEYKPRADYVTGVLAAGGIETIWSEECVTAHDVEAFISTTNHAYYCLCGTEDSYNQLVPEIIQKFASRSFVLDIAGTDQFDVDGFIIKGQDIPVKISNIVSRVEGLIRE